MWEKESEMEQAGNIGHLKELSGAAHMWGVEGREGLCLLSVLWNVPHATPGVRLIDSDPDCAWL